MSSSTISPCTTLSTRSDTCVSIPRPCKSKALPATTIDSGQSTQTPNTVNTEDSSDTLTYSNFLITHCSVHSFFSTRAQNSLTALSSKICHVLNLSGLSNFPCSSFTVPFFSTSSTVSASNSIFLFVSSR